jgi:hypothetical protein
MASSKTRDGLLAPSPTVRALLVSGLLVLCAFLAAGCGGGGGGAADGDADQGEAGREEKAQTDGVVRPAGIPGRWSHTPRWVRADGDLTPEQQRRIQELESLAYVAGSKPAGSVAGVTVHDGERAAAGLNLYTSGHAPEAILMDMDGRVLHRWSLPFQQVWPDREPEVGGHFWRRAHLYPDGDLLVIWESRGMARIDAASHLIWANDALIHHDIEVGPDGEIYTLSRKGHVVPRIHLTEPILEDFLLVLDPGDGHVVRQVSLLEALESAEPEHRELMRRLRHRGKPGYGDIFHTNTVTYLDGRIADRLPAFAAGNILTSLRELNAIAVLDLAAGRIVWTAVGEFNHQHDPQILDSGNLLLFDNRGLGRWSAVREYDPATMEQVWIYQGSRGTPFFSQSCGTTQRLPNGNTLITESDSGRAFEVTPEGEIVWEFWSPHRAGKSGELIATLFDVVRLPLDFPHGWARP